MHCRNLLFGRVTIVNHRNHVHTQPVVHPNKRPDYVTETLDRFSSTNKPFILTNCYPSFMPFPTTYISYD